jgi:aminodeoxyfutalosine deaminase
VKKITADYILSHEGKFVRDMMIVSDESGRVVEISPVLDEPDVIKYNGILCPGFINAHCHLELSHLAGKIEKNSGLDGFIRSFIPMRAGVHPDISKMKNAADTMWNNGIQGVGDICNTTDTFVIKSAGPIRYHNFIELFNIDASKVQQTFESGLQLLQQSQENKLRASMVPHAPYSVPPVLFELIRDHSNKNQSLWSMHNQESKTEDEMFLSGKGKLYDLLNSLGVDLSWHFPANKSSLRTVSDYFPETKMLFVHNTFTEMKDVMFLERELFKERTWLCVCPNANLYIENTLPDIQLFHDSGFKIVIGTDSLASNDTLSVFEEIKTIAGKFENIPLENILTWATKNGAEYFGWDDLGAFEVNNVPGCVLIKNVDTQKMRLNKLSDVQRIF